MRACARNCEGYSVEPTHTRTRAHTCVHIGWRVEVERFCNAKAALLFSAVDGPALALIANRSQVEPLVDEFVRARSSVEEFLYDDVKVCCSASTAQGTRLGSASG